MTAATKKSVKRIPKFTEPKKVNFGTIIKSLREKQGIKAIELSRLTGINPRTLAAMELGQIKNPALSNIEAVARALQLTLAEFFAMAESSNIEGVYHGTQKGEAVLHFPDQGFKMVSYTPLAQEFFVGKVVMVGGSQMESDRLPLKATVFLQLIMGKIVVRAGLKEYFLKEGDHFLINRFVSRTITNPTLREATFSITTIPSIFKF